MPDIIGNLDYIEVAGWQISELNQRPHPNLILHNLDLNWSLAHPNALDDTWEVRVNQAMRSTGSPWFSAHLGFSTEQVKFCDHMHPVGKSLSRDELITRYITVLRQAKNLCPAPLLVENLDYCPDGAYEHITEPAFINAVATSADVGILLDLAHLQVSASWQELDPLEYLNQLPLERVQEIHISSPRRLQSNAPLLDDGHYELLDRDYHLLREALRKCPAQTVTLEYRREPYLLEEQVKRLRALIGR